MRLLVKALTALVLLTALVMPMAAAPQAADTSVGTRAHSDPLKASDSGLYIVQLKDAPLASYRGGIAQLAATNPRVTGARKLDTASVASRAYRNYLEGQRLQVLKAIERVLGRAPEVVFSYDLAFNGMALRLSLADAQKIAGLQGIARIAPDQLRELQTDTGPAFIGAAQSGPQHYPALYKAVIEAAQEVPPTSSTATGEAYFTYDADTSTLLLRISYNGLSGTPTGAHIHQAAAGVNGSVIEDLTPYAVGPLGTSGVMIGSVTLTSGEESALYADGLYVNIHTAANPSGEIRGQIIGNQGEGMLAGIIDSGINFAHKSFADIGADGYDHTNPLGSGTYVGVCNPANDDYQPSFACNDKLIGAWTYPVLEDPSPLGEPSPADDDGHGSHTASTTAGNIVTSTIVLSPAGTLVETGYVGGVAPHANIIAYDVCDAVGCYLSAIIGAINQTVDDGVDVINYSIGGGSTNPWEDFDALTFLNAFEAGVLPVTSAGNSGPERDTLGSPGNAPWLLTVAASTHNRIFPNSLVDLAGGATTPPGDIDGTAVSSGMASAAPIVYAGNYQDEDGEPNPQCTNDFAPGTSFAGQIVVCDWGSPGRVARANRVLALGAVGFVLANTEPDGTTRMVDSYPLPATHITYEDAEALRTWLANGTGHTGRITGMSGTPTTQQGDVMATFSSRGPAANANDVLKPDITAPGVGILAAVANSDPDRAEFDFYGGTSMASPHAAGAATLLRAMYPTWSLAEIESALITTAVRNDVVKEDGTTPSDPFDRGGGRVDVRGAAMAGLVMDETPEMFATANPNEDGQPRNLNRPGLADGACVVTCTWTRTFRSTLAVSATWTANVSGTTGLGLTVTPSSFTIQPGATQTVTISADVSALPLDEYVFGHVTFTSGGNRASAATLPVAVQPVASDLPESLTIETDDPAGSTTINVKSVAVSELTANEYGLVRGIQAKGSLRGDRDNSTPYDDLNDGVLIESYEVMSGTLRFVTEVITSSSPDLDMYVHLDGSDGSQPDGIPSPDELVCISATGVALERCDLLDPEAGTYLVLIQNWEASSSVRPDSFTLSTGIVPADDLGNMEVTGPATNPQGGTFGLQVAWNLTLQPGDRWYGAFDLGTAPAQQGDLGLTTVDLISTIDTYRTFAPIIRK